MSLRITPETPMRARVEALAEHFDPRQWPFWRDLFTVGAFNALFALILTVFAPSGGARHDSYFGNFVFSQCIGLLIWIGVVSSWHLVARPLPRVIAFIVCIALGELIGWNFAAWLLGVRSSPFAPEVRVHWPMWVGLCALATVVNFYYFWSRERLARARAELAQAAAERQAQERETARALMAAQLATLQAQIEPHFLFNTLANLRSLITRDPALAQHMLDRLITYLRTTLASARAGNSSLEREFALAGAYLEIQSIRMGDRLAFSLDLPAELQNQPIPPMLLQPLVENAIRHGIEPRPGKGAVHLAASREGARLNVRVRDDGIGFGAAATGGTGVGLSNVRERLLALYGEAARLVIEEPADGGVSVRLELPA